MLAITTVALAVPLALLRRHRAGANPFKVTRITSPSTSPPPVRRISARGVSSAVPPRHVVPQQGSTSTIETSSGRLARGASDASLRVSREDRFNGALYSFKAFSIATALVVTSGAASVWGMKTYLGIKDTQEFASAMRLTLLTRWPLLTSRIHRASDSAPPPSPVSFPVTTPTTSVPQKVPPPTAAVPDVDGWNWSAAQARLAAAYERGGVMQFAEAAVGELEAEAELERRKRVLGASTESLAEGRS